MKIWILYALLLTSCLSNRMRFDPNFDTDTRPPDYEDYLDRWWWGFHGHPRLDLAKICVDQKPLAFDVSKRAQDVMFTVITLGIYTPTTLRVWCGDRHE